MNAWSAWTIAGLLLGAAELIHPGVFLLWIGFAALVVGGATRAVDLDVPAQVAAFAAVLSVALWVSLRRHRGRRRGPAGVNAPDVGLVGRPCRALAFAGPEGRVGFRDGTWAARTADGSEPAPGTALRIVGLDGTTLLVVAA